MADNDHLAAAAPADSASPVDEEDRLRPEFVDKVLDAVDAGDDETARRLVQPLHPADVADLIELAARDEREGRSEEHTSELQSHSDLVCRLLLEKKKKKKTTTKKSKKQK